MPGPAAGIALNATSRVDNFTTVDPQTTLWRPCASDTYRNERFVEMPRSEMPLTQPTWNTEVVFNVERITHYTGKQWLEIELPSLPDASGTSNLRYVQNVADAMIEYVEFQADGRAYTRDYQSLTRFLRLRKRDPDMGYDGPEVGTFPTTADRTAFSRGEGGSGGSCALLRLPLSLWFNEFMSQALPMAAIVSVTPTIHIRLRQYEDIVERISLDASQDGNSVVPSQPTLRMQLISQHFTVKREVIDKVVAKQHQYLMPITQKVYEKSLTGDEVKRMTLRYPSSHPHTQHVLFFQHQCHIDGRRPFASYVEERWTTDVNRYRKVSPFEYVNLKLDNKLLHAIEPDAFFTSRYATDYRHRHHYDAAQQLDDKPAVFSYAMDADGFAPSGSIAFGAVANNYIEVALKGHSNSTSPLLAHVGRPLFITPMRTQSARFTVTTSANLGSNPLSSVFLQFSLNGETYAVGQDVLYMGPGEVVDVDLGFQRAELTVVSSSVSAAGSSASPATAIVLDLHLTTTDATLIPHTISNVTVMGRNNANADISEYLQVSAQMYHENSALVYNSHISGRKNTPVKGGRLVLFARSKIPITIAGGTMSRFVGGRA